MFFNSYEFLLLFLPTTLLFYYALLYYKRVKLSQIFLVIASLLFYAFSSFENTLLLLFSISINFSIVTLFSFNYFKKGLLLFGLIFNLALLSYYKYSNFFIENVNQFFATDIKYLYITLPLAISFFTFQQIAFLVDSYNSKIRERSFLNYMLFVSFFPQLIIGPIVKYQELIPQFFLHKNLKFNAKNSMQGLFLIAIGLFKKVILADTLAHYSEYGFSNIANLDMIDAWTTIVAFTFQIYFDFSGYTDIALGVALLFNITLPINFNSPYKAKNIQEAWQSWHITLTRFFVTYLYFPLVKRYKAWRYFILVLIFAISGLWHGAAWNFVVWGMSFSVAMLVYQFWKEYGFTLPPLVAWFITFLFILLSVVFFRAESIEDAILLLEHLFGFAEKWNEHYHFPYKLEETSTLFISALTIFFFPNGVSFAKQLQFRLWSAFFVAFLLIFSIVMIGESYEFIYFNF